MEPSTRRASQRKINGRTGLKRVFITMSDHRMLTMATARVMGIRTAGCMNSDCKVYLGLSFRFQACPEDRLETLSCPLTGQKVPSICSHPGVDRI